MYKGGRWERGQVTPLWVISRPEQGVCERKEERPDHRGLGSRMIEGHGGDIRGGTPWGTQSLL